MSGKGNAGAGPPSFKGKGYGVPQFAPPQFYSGATAGVALPYDPSYLQMMASFSGYDPPPMVTPPWGTRVMYSNPEQSRVQEESWSCCEEPPSHPAASSASAACAAAEGRHPDDGLKSHSKSGTGDNIDGLHGRIKSFNVKKAFGFIESNYLKQRSMGDAFLTPEGMAPFQVGDEVIFDVRFNSKNQPQARNILGVKNLVGSIKSFNPTKGYGFIECEALREHSLQDVFLHQAQKGRFEVSMRVQFSVRFNDAGQPQAHSLIPADTCSTAAAEEADTSHATTDATDMKHQFAEASADVLEGLCFNGTVKSFNAKNGYGFIDSEKLKKLGMRDIFVHQIQLGSIQIGSAVSFTLNFNGKGQPQAQNVEAESEDAVLENPQSAAASTEPLTAACPAASSAEIQRSTIRNEKLQGFIKSFNDTKGFGFIECEYLRDRGVCQDVFLLRTDLGGFRSGDRVSFSVRLNDKGQMQATDLKCAETAETRKQHEQLEQYLRESHVCVVCQSNPIQSMYNLCGHACLCEDCSLKEDASLDRCPVCRTPGPRKRIFIA